MPDNDKPKFIVDSDWKAQAQAEKERLAAQARQKAAQTPPAAPASAGPAAGAATPSEGAAQGGAHELPQASLTTLISMIASQAMLSLGIIPDPRSRQRYVDLDMARYHIDTLKVIEDKTAGNLTDAERDLLNRTLYDLRTQFVQVGQRMIAI